MADTPRFSAGAAPAPAGVDPQHPEPAPARADGLTWHPAPQQAEPAQEQQEEDEDTGSATDLTFGAGAFADPPDSRVVEAIGPVLDAEPEHAIADLDVPQVGADVAGELHVPDTMHDVDTSPESLPLEG